MLEVRQQVQYEPGGRWSWCAWVEGSRELLGRVDFVQYRLPPDFVNPVCVMRDPADAFRVEERGVGMLRHLARVAIRLRNGEVLYRAFELVLLPPDILPVRSVSLPMRVGLSRVPHWRPDLEEDREITARLLSRLGVEPPTGTDGRSEMDDFLAAEIPKLLLLARRLMGSLQLKPEQLVDAALQQVLPRNAFADADDFGRREQLRTAVLTAVESQVQRFACFLPHQLSAEIDLPGALEALAAEHRDNAQRLLEGALAHLGELPDVTGASLGAELYSVYVDGAVPLARELIHARARGFLDVLDDPEALVHLISDEIIAGEGPDLLDP